MSRIKSKLLNFILIKFSVVAVLLAFIYLFANIYIITGALYPSPIDRIITYLLLFAELTATILGVGFILNLLHVLKRSEIDSFNMDMSQPTENHPSVAVIVASYKEPLKVLKDTLISFCNLDYPRKKLFLLDDTRYDISDKNYKEVIEYRSKVDELAAQYNVSVFRHKWRGAKAGIINDYLKFLKKNAEDGFEFQDNSDELPIEDFKYLAVFDADQNPLPDFLNHLIPKLENDQKLAFIQTPQCYTNVENNLVAGASGLQQALFFDCICRGKGVQEAMICCGTNVVFRIDALNDVKGFDESSLTEDFSTSLEFHLRGWKSCYYEKALAFGMGPEDLGSYFKQQYRWAYGCIGVFKRVLINFLKNPFNLSPAQWWEYFLSSGYYFVGFAYFIMALCPALFITLDIPSYSLGYNVIFYRNIISYAYIPYFLLIICLYVSSLRIRKYRLIDILKGHILITASFPVLIKAVVLSLFDVKEHFIVTSKGKGSVSLPISYLLPQILMSVLCLNAAVWGVIRLLDNFDPLPFSLGLLSVFWCFYFFVVFISILLFNNSSMNFGLGKSEL